MFTVKELTDNGTITMYAARIVAVHPTNSVYVIGYQNDTVLYPEHFMEVKIENTDGKIIDVIHGKTS